MDLAARERLLNALVHLQNDVPALSTVIVTHHLEELPPSTTHAALLRDGRIHAAGPVDAVLNSENVSTAFDHPVIVQRAGGRWSARASDPALLGRSLASCIAAHCTADGIADEDDSPPYARPNQRERMRHQVINFGLRLSTPRAPRLLGLMTAQFRTS